MAFGCSSINEAKPALDPWNSHDGRTELTPMASGLSPPYCGTSMHASVHIHQLKKRSNENSKYINNSAQKQSR